jgi:hypothetical protein
VSWADRHRPPIAGGDRVQYAAQFLRILPLLGFFL